MKSIQMEKNPSSRSRSTVNDSKNGKGIEWPGVPIVQTKKIIQMITTEDEEDLTNSVQLKSAEEDELLQGKFTIQKVEKEDELPVQGKFFPAKNLPIQKKEITPRFEAVPGSAYQTEKADQIAAPAESFQTKHSTLQKKDNNTGLPDNLKEGVENLSKTSMDDVKVHYNSEKPSKLNALAYAQGNDIHIGSGQEKHLPHEAWHVVQQKQGRVQPSFQMKEGAQVNDDEGLENEANVMGSKAFTIGHAITANELSSPVQRYTTNEKQPAEQGGKVVQRIIGRGVAVDGTVTVVGPEEKKYKITGKGQKFGYYLLKSVDGEESIEVSATDQAYNIEKQNGVAEPKQEAAPDFFAETVKAMGPIPEMLYKWVNAQDANAMGFTKHTRYRDSNFTKRWDLSKTIDLTSIGFSAQHTVTMDVHFERGIPFEAGSLWVNNVQKQTSDLQLQYCPGITTLFNAWKTKYTSGGL